MSFFGSKLFGLSSNGTGGSANGTSGSLSSISGAETIERLCDRVQSSLLIEDRHESLRAIKSLSKKYKLEVGTQAMPVLIDVLKQNKNDTDLCCLVIDTFFNIMNADENDKQANLPADISNQFTEMFIKENSNLTLLFDLLDEFEFQTRWSTVKLINQIILNQLQQAQDIILQIPRGVSRLMDLLNDSREVIRNDAILLLNNLTKTNANIQKIIAFESGFDRIMEIIEGEGSVLDGGVVVEDCFNLLLNLLQTNYSNQSFFKEANYIKKICKYLDLNSSTMGGLSSSGLNGLDVNPGEALSPTTSWSLQKTTNLSLLLKLIRCLVAPNNSQQIVIDCQKAFSHFGLLHRLCALLTLPGVPADLLGEAITTVGEVIRGNAPNQQLFSTVTMQTSPPRPIIVVLLMSMVNEKQPFHLRCSILYCFQCFLYKNEEKKSEVIETLLPKDLNQQAQASQSQGGPPQLTTGQILCSGLFSPNDFVSNWLCATTLAHTLNDNVTLKDQLLRVQLAVNGQAVSLLQQCMNILIESSATANSGTASSVAVAAANTVKFQTMVSVLMLLSSWLSNCPAAVNMFLSQQQNIPYLISQASATDTEDRSLIIQGLSSFLLGLNLLYNSNKVATYTVDNLKDIIKKRIGIEQFEHKLEFITQHEAYTKTLKQPTFAFKGIKPKDLLFDFEFTRLFKSNETLIVNLLTNKNQNIPLNGTKNGLPSKTGDDKRLEQLQQQVEQQTAVMTQYQQIIRDQDTQLREYYQANQTIVQTCGQLQERNAYLESQHTSSNGSSESQQLLSDKLKYQARINELELKVNQLEEKCSEQEDEISRSKREKGAFSETMNGPQVEHLNKKIRELNEEQESLLVLLTEMEEKLKKYKRLTKQLGHQVSDDEDENGIDENGDEQITTAAVSTVKPADVKQQEPTFKPDVKQGFNNFNGQFFTPLPPLPQLQPLNLNEPPRPEIAHSLYGQSNPSNGINFTSTANNHHHHHDHDHDHDQNDADEENEPEQKFDLSEDRNDGDNYTASATNAADSAERKSYDGLFGEVEPTLNYPKNNIFHIIESNALAHSSDNSSPISEHYNVNSSSSSSNNTNFSPEQNRSGGMQPTPAATKLANPVMHEIQFNQSDPQSSTFVISSASSSAAAVNPSGQHLQHQQQQQFYGQPSQPQFNFFQYFNNPTQTEQFQTQMGGSGAHNNNQLQNFFK